MIAVGLSLHVLSTDLIDIQTGNLRITVYQSFALVLIICFYAKNMIKIKKNYRREERSPTWTVSVDLTSFPLFSFYHPFILSLLTPFLIEKRCRLKPMLILSTFLKQIELHAPVFFAPYHFSKRTPNQTKKVAHSNINDSKVQLI